MNSTSLVELNEEQMQEVCGGGFAYDVGRVLRFFAIGISSPNIAFAITDWQVNEIINEAANDPQ